MKANLDTLNNAWFNDNKESALNNYALCSEWLDGYVRNCDQEFLHDFFEGEEIESNSVARIPVARIPVARIPGARIPVARIPVARIPVARIPEDRNFED